MMDLDAVVRRLEIEVLYTNYAHCLDDDALEQWPDFFVENCYYRITSAENYEADLPLGLVYLTSRAMVADRVMALRKANIYEPQCYRHVISAMKIVGGDQNQTDIVANFVVIRTMQEGGMSVFAAGRYLDRVVRVGNGWKFARKDVVLDSRQIDTLLAIPL